jgi:hypothetical protein
MGTKPGDFHHACCWFWQFLYNLSHASFAELVFLLATFEQLKSPMAEEAAKAR